MILFTLLAPFVIANAVDSSAIVETSSGLIRGHVKENQAAESGAIYYAFQGIPFAEPPIGKLRFMPPREPNKWTGILDVTEEKLTCVSYDVGDEDCLYLSVYTNKLPRHRLSKLKPVMYFIHGGAFLFGAAYFNMTQPDLFLNEDVVLVVINYRVNVFGFLNVMEEQYLGNVGLRDQIAALQWIQENIENFGGDPNKVTIFGQSAGGASIQYLILSQLSKGLFHHAISESGSSLNSWAYYIGDSRKMAFRLGNILGIYTNSSTELLKELQKVDAVTLYEASASDDMYVEERYNPLIAQPFEPSIEPDHPAAFISESCYKSLREGRFHHVPYLVGYNNLEGNYALWYVSRRILNLSIYDEDHELLVPLALNLKKGSTNSKIVAQKIMEEFFSNAPPSNQLAFQNYNSEELFDRAIRKSVSLMREYTNVYQYKFTYEAEPSDTVWVRGHGAELGSLFYSEPRNENDTRTQKRMVRLWTNFARTGNPTPNKDPLLENVFWKHSRNIVGKGNPYLEIGADLELKYNVDHDFYKFWKNIFKQFGNTPYFIW